MSPAAAGAARCRIVLADDHRIVREGLRALLAGEAGFEVVGVAEDGLGAIDMARRLAPDVVVVDVNMPGLNGIETVRRLRTETPAARVLCLSAHDEQRLVLAMIEAGAAGYVLKDTSFDELAGAIRSVLAGRVHVSPSLVGIFVEQYRASTSAVGQTVKSSTTPLTPRERELVQLFSEGYSTQDIAERLHLSAKTVATHRENIQHKLHIGGIAEMTRYALREGLSSLEARCRSGS